MKKNKIAILFSLIFLVFSLVQLADVTLAVTCTGNFTELPGAGVCVPNNTGLPDKEVGAIISNFLMWLLGIFGFIAIIGFIVSGLQYLTSAGDEEAVKKAKTNMKWCMVGIIVALSGLVVVKAIDAALNVANKQF